MIPRLSVNQKSRLVTLGRLLARLLTETRSRPLRGLVLMAWQEACTALDAPDLERLVVDAAPELLDVSGVAAPRLFPVQGGGVLSVIGDLLRHVSVRDAGGVPEYLLHRCELHGVTKQEAQDLAAQVGIEVPGWMWGRYGKARVVSVAV